MTPQALLKARFSELAESLGVGLSARRQGGKFYFTVRGDWAATSKFMQSSFPAAWMTSGGAGEVTYGLPLADVERALAEARVAPAWSQHNGAAALRIAQQIRGEGAFEHLPVLADALEEAGCDNAALLSHCRAAAPHRQTCWVVELLLGAERGRRGSPRPVKR
jgi:hypothetical protein